MRTCFVVTAILTLILFSIPNNVSAIETSPRINDREIIESLAEIKAGQKTIEKRFDDTTKRIDDLKEGQVKLEGRINNLENRIDNLIYAVLGGFIVILGSIIGLISVVIWDRRTALSPAIRKNKELEEREDKVEKALKEYAYKEPRLAEILRNVGII